MEAGSRRWDPQILATRPVVSDKALRLCREEFPQRQTVVKQVFIKREKSTLLVDKHVSKTQREHLWVAPWGSLNHFYGAFLPGFLWPVMMICWFTVCIYLAYLRILLCVSTHLLAKMHFTAKAYGWSISWHCPPPSELQGVFLHMRGPGGLLTSSRTRNMGSRLLP